MSKIEKYLLDANLLIAALDKEGTTSQTKREEARKMLSELLGRDDVAVAITPLIRYEALRGIGWTAFRRYQDIAEALNQFESFDITRDIADLATHLYRFDSYEVQQSGSGKNLEKLKFDVFHYACVKCHELKLVSADADIARIETLYQRYLEAVESGMN